MSPFSPLIRHSLEHINFNRSLTGICGFVLDHFDCANFTRLQIHTMKYLRKRPLAEQAQDFECRHAQRIIIVKKDSVI